MARSKGRRSHVARHNPLSATNAPVRTITTKKNTVKPFIAKLASVDPKVRAESAAAVGAMLLQDAESRKVLMNANVMSLLVDRLSDSSRAVQVEASGALRNLVFDETESQNSCEALFKLNTLTLLESAMKAFLSGVSSTAELEPSQEMKYDLMYVENISAILLAMCESSDEILRGIVQVCTFLIPFLLTIIKLDKGCPKATRIMAAQCLMSYTDDNHEGVSRLASDPASIDILSQIMSSTKAALSIPIAGTFQNVLSANTLTSFQSVSTERVVETVRNVVLSASLTDLATRESEEQSTTLTVYETSLETLAKAVTLSQKHTEDEDQDMMGSTDLTETQTRAFTIIIQELLDPITRLACPIDIPADQVYPVKLHMTHLLALDCMHNLAWTMVELSSAGALIQLWHERAPYLWQWTMATLPRLLTIDEDISDSTLSLLYALARSLSVRITYDDASSFIKLYHSSLNADLQTKIVGLLGRLATTQGQIDINRTIGTFLMTVVASLPRTDTDAAIEALDAIFDIYADAAFDYDEPVFVQNNFLGHLQDALPKVVAMKKGISKRTHRELWNRADEALENLRGFINYKKNERTVQ